MLFTSGERLLLYGKVVQEDGDARERFIYMKDGTIQAITPGRPPGTQDLTPVMTGRYDWIYPGLLDLHSHSSYNILPIWDSPNAPYPNRFAWRGSEEYQEGIKDYDAYLRKPHQDPDEPKRKPRTHKVERAALAELQAIAGGVTVLQESYTLEEQAGHPEETVLCRGTGNPHEMGLPDDAEILSLVDLFRPDQDGNPAPVGWAMQKYLDARNKGTLKSTLVHLAEGRSGFGSSDGPDSYTRREFEAFMAHPAFQDADAVKQSPFNLIHACGLDPYSDVHLNFLKERDISVIWSPVSNLLLYDETIDIGPLMQAGVNVVLGSDWSPSGSKHVWDEAKFARFFFDALEVPISDALLFQMITAHAARCLGTYALGRLTAGAMADLFIIRSPFETDNPMEVFFKASDRDVLAVLVGGEPIYGDGDFLAQFGRTLQPLPRVEGSAVANKRVHLPADIHNEYGQALDVDRDMMHLEQMLKHPPAPMKPEKRSNLLSSSDRPYRERLANLRRDTIEYAWRIYNWRGGGHGVS